MIPPQLYLSVLLVRTNTEAILKINKAVFCQAGASFAEEVAHCARDLVKREDRDHVPGLA